MISSNCKPMRYLLTLMLIIWLNHSYSQPNTEVKDSNRVYLTGMQQFFDTNESLNVPDSVKRQTLYNELKSVILKHPANEINFNAIFLWGLNLTHTQVDTLINLIDTSIKNAPSKVWADLTLNRTSVVETGRPFPSLILKDSLDNELLLSDLKGKVILLDVWSSWCVPCREQIPELRKLYKKYNSKGFEIIGISMDDNKQRWLKAIQEDKQLWKQYCEFVNWRSNKFAARFYSYAIPDNFLINENGILVGQNLTTEAISSWITRHY